MGPAPGIVDAVLAALPIDSLEPSASLRVERGVYGMRSEHRGGYNIALG